MDKRIDCKQPFLQITSKMNEGDFIIESGDCNRHVGQQIDRFHGVTGGCCFCPRNEEWKSLLESCDTTKETSRNQPATWTPIDMVASEVRLSRNQMEIERYLWMYRQAASGLEHKKWDIETSLEMKVM